MKNRIEKSDIDFLCQVTKDLAFVAQRINRQLAKGGTPKAGTQALDGFRKIDFPRLKRLQDDLPTMQIDSMVACYNAVKESEKNGWRSYVFKWAWKPELYDLHNPMKSMSVVEWGVVAGENDYGVSWTDGLTVPLSWRLSQHGQVRTLLDIAKTLNESYHFKSPLDFQRVYSETISKNIGRGTFSGAALQTLIDVLNRNQDEFFRSGCLDFKKYADAVECDLEDDATSPIGHLFIQRTKIMFLRVASLMNDIMHYDCPDGFRSDIKLICSGDRGGCFVSQHSFIGTLSGTICAHWGKFCDKSGVLDSVKLEHYFHSRHFDKVKSEGLTDVLAKDFVHNPATDEQKVFGPKHEFSAPIYVEDRFFEDHCTGDKLFVKSCGSCGDVFAHEYFEFQMIVPIIEREIKAGNYIRRNEYILPTHDDSLPIFREGHGRVNFEMMHDQISFMHHFRDSGRLPDVDI